MSWTMSWKRLLVSVVVGLAVLGLGCRINPTTFLDSLEQFIIHTPNGDGSCTAWSLNEPLGYWVTAGHCISGFPDLYYDIKGFPVTVVRLERSMDIAVVQTQDYHVPALHVSPSKPRVGDHVIAVGYHSPMGTPADLVTAVEGVILETDRPDTEPKLWVTNLFFRVPYARLYGISGGPVLDKYGNVVSVYQGFMNDTEALGSTWTDLRIITTNYKELQ